MKKRKKMFSENMAHKLCSQVSQPLTVYWRWNLLQCWLTEMGGGWTVNQTAFVPILAGLGRFRFFMIFSNSSKLFVKRGLNLRSSPTVETVWPDEDKHTRLVVTSRYFVEMTFPESQWEITFCEHISDALVHVCMLTYIFLCKIFKKHLAISLGRM